jgi:3-deoxy-D-manno-octulosonic-acid transferase
MFILFDILFTLYFILYLPFLFLRGKWHAGFSERFGFFAPEMIRLLSRGENIWIHAVSVGEAAAMEGVINGLKGRFPGKRIVLTVATKTGYSFAQRKYAGVVTLCWAPLDLSLTVDHFVRVIRPQIYVAAETELWPNLFARLGAAKVPVVIVNGRISDKAFGRYRAVKFVLKSMLRQVSVFGMQSALDAERIIALGAPKARVIVAGNVKFDNVPASVAVDPREFGCEKDFLLLVGGSTHAGEEEILVDIWQGLRAEYPLLRLILAPRHPERAASVADLVRKAGFKPVFFSNIRGILKPDEVMIVDTIGHLIEFYSLASVVFVGKSLTARGGHNIVEPAQFARPVLIGPYMQNFRDITAAFLAEKAVVQVEGAVGLKAAVRALLDGPELRRDLGLRARQVVRRNQGATRRVIDLVSTVKFQ